MRLILLSSVLVVGALVANGAVASAAGGEPDGRVEADTRAPGSGGGGGGSDPDPPAPECWWVNVSADRSDVAGLQQLWRQLDAGEHYANVHFFLRDGALHQTWMPTGVTSVRQVRVCSDETHDDHGEVRWQPVGPPDPAVYLPDLYERVTEQVPAPEWDLGFGDGGGPVDVFVNVGLWVSVSNADDVVARAEVPGAWAETRATLDHIEFDPGNGDAVVVCEGAGTPLPADRADDPAPGPCGYTYDAVGDLGERAGAVRAVWRVENSTSTGAYERRADIVLESAVPMHVYEVQTVGGPND